jgi:hypothetical protein
MRSRLHNRASIGPPSAHGIAFCIVSSSTPVLPQRVFEFLGAILTGILSVKGIIGNRVDRWYDHTSGALSWHEIREDGLRNAVVEKVHKPRDENFQSFNWSNDSLFKLF